MGLDDRNKGVEMTMFKVEEVRGLEDQVLPWDPTLWVESPRMKVGLKVMMHAGTKVFHKFGGMTKSLEDESDMEGKAMEQPNDRGL